MGQQSLEGRALRATSHYSRCWAHASPLCPLSGPMMLLAPSTHAYGLQHVSAYPSKVHPSLPSGTSPHSSYMYHAAPVALRCTAPLLRADMVERSVLTRVDGMPNPRRPYICGVSCPM